MTTSLSRGWSSSWHSPKPCSEIRFITEMLMETTLDEITFLSPSSASKIITARNALSLGVLTAPMCKLSWLRNVNRTVCMKG